MDSQTAREFVLRRLMPLWPHWRPSEPEIQIWQNWLCDYQLDEAEERLQRYYGAIGCHAARPEAKDMLTIGRKSPACQSQVIIRCTKHDRKPGYVGQRRRIYIIGTPTTDVAERLASRFEQQYGGSWTVEV